MLLLLGVSAVSVMQQLRETFFYSNGREAFESEPLLSLPVAFAGRDDLGRYHRWITVQRYTEKATNRSFLLIGRLRSPASRLEVDLVSIQSDGTRSMRSISGDDRGESYPVHRVLAALGDESLAVYPFQFWTFLPVLLLPLTGPWIGLGVSLVALGIKALAGNWYRRRSSPPGTERSSRMGPFAIGLVASALISDSLPAQTSEAVGLRARHSVEQVADRTVPSPQPTRTQHASGKGRTFLGAAIGIAVGGLAGYYLTIATCESCDDAGPAWFGAAIGASVGGELGAVAGASSSPRAPREHLSGDAGRSIIQLRRESTAATLDFPMRK